MTSKESDFYELLSRVGIFEAESHLELCPGVMARTYRSSYVKLYIATCSYTSEIDWSSTIRAADKTIYEAMRSAEIAEGGVIDSHVCFVVHDAQSAAAWAQLNERAVRNVSRKYWIEQANFLEQLTNRLPFLPISDPPTLDRDDELSLTAEDSAWLEVLMTEGPTLAFSRFSANMEPG